MRGQERIKNCSTVSGDPLIGCHPKQLPGGANATYGDILHPDLQVYLQVDLQVDLKDAGLERLEVVIQLFLDCAS